MLVYRGLRARWQDDRWCNPEPPSYVYGVSHNTLCSIGTLILGGRRLKGALKRKKKFFSRISKSQFHYT